MSKNKNKKQRPSKELIDDLKTRYLQLHKELDPYREISKYIKMISEEEDELRMLKSTLGEDGERARLFAHLDKKVEEEIETITPKDKHGDSDIVV